MNNFTNPIAAAEYILQHYTGEMVEIGAGHGHTTKELLKLADKYNRTVIVIDPFEQGWQDMPPTYRYAYTAFKNNIEGFEKNLIIHKRSSSCITSEQLCKDMEICFSFVDGLQYKGA